MEEAIEALDLEMKQKIDSIKKEYSEKKKDLKKKFKKEKPKDARPSIPKSLKNKVWNEYIGKEKGVGICMCCGSEIDSKKFDCGHIEAVVKGGKTILENLRPICSTCNKSMGDQNLLEFKEKYFPDEQKVEKEEKKAEDPDYGPYASYFEPKPRPDPETYMRAMLTGNVHPVTGEITNNLLPNWS